MDLQKATKEIISFLTTINHPKILCIGISKDNAILQDKVFALCGQLSISAEFDFRKTGLYMKDNKYEWFCKFINLSLAQTKIRNIEMLLGYTSKNTLIVINNLPPQLNYIFDVISSYLNNNNKTELIRIWT